MQNVCVDYVKCCTHFAQGTFKTDAAYEFHTCMLYAFMVSWNCFGRISFSPGYYKKDDAGTVSPISLRDETFILMRRVDAFPRPAGIFL